MNPVKLLEKNWKKILIFMIIVITSLVAYVGPSNYVIFAKARYDDVVGTGRSIFRVIEKEELAMGEITTFSLIAVIFVLFIIVVILNLFKESIHVKTIKY